jgi:hypothetical protein
MPSRMLLAAAYSEACRLLLAVWRRPSQARRLLLAGLPRQVFRCLELRGSEEHLADDRSGAGTRKRAVLVSCVSPRPGPCGGLSGLFGGAPAPAASLSGALSDAQLATGGLAN